MASNLLIEILRLLAQIVGLYQWVIIAAVIFSWLIAFNVMNPHNEVVRNIWYAINVLTEPLLRPIRRLMPDMGGLDISPIILLLGCYFVQGVIYNVLIPAVAGTS